MRLDHPWTLAFQAAVTSLDRIVSSPVAACIITNVLVVVVLKEGSSSTPPLLAEFFLVQLSDGRTM